MTEEPEDLIGSNSESHKSKLMKPKKKKLVQQKIKATLVSDSIESAKSAGLRHVADSDPGIRRRRVGKGFRYIGADGKPGRNRQALRRFKALAIPAAWIDVWICANPDGHIQATARGYLLHMSFPSLFDFTGAGSGKGPGKSTRPFRGVISSLCTGQTTRHRSKDSR